MSEGEKKAFFFKKTAIAFCLEIAVVGTFSKLAFPKSFCNLNGKLINLFWAFLPKKQFFVPPVTFLLMNGARKLFFVLKRSRATFNQKKVSCECCVVLEKKR